MFDVLNVLVAYCDTSVFVYTRAIETCTGVNVHVLSVIT